MIKSENVLKTRPLKKWCPAVLNRMRESFKPQMSILFQSTPQRWHHTFHVVWSHVSCITWYNRVDQNGSVWWWSECNIWNIWLLNIQTNSRTFLVIHDKQNTNICLQEFSRFILDMHLIISSPLSYLDWTFFVPLNKIHFFSKFLLIFFWLRKIYENDGPVQCGRSYIKANGLRE